MKIGGKMEKLVGMLLVMVFVLMGGCAYAEDESDVVLFEPTLLSVLEKSTNEIIETNASRALFTLLAMLDINFSTTLPADFDITKPSYIGMDGEGIVLLMRLQQTALMTEENGKAIMVIYYPDAKEGRYVITDDAEDWTIEIFLNDICGDNWYENDTDSLYMVATLLQNAFEEYSN